VIPPSLWHVLPAGLHRKDRPAIERLLDDTYQFTSPIDNALDRESYLRVCWPNSAMMTRFDRIHEAEDGTHAFIVYEAARPPRVSAFAIASCTPHGTASWSPRRSTSDGTFRIRSVLACTPRMKARGTRDIRGAASGQECQRDAPGEWSRYIGWLITIALIAIRAWCQLLDSKRPDVLVV